MKKNILNTQDILFIAIGGALMSLFWFGWTFVDDTLRPLLKPLGLDTITTGVWLMGGIFFPYVIRKPMTALLGEVITSLFEGMITHYGLSALIWGVAQGILPEILFLVLRYRKWNFITVILASLLSCVGSIGYELLSSQEGLLSLNYLIRHIGLALISAVIFAGLTSKLLADTLYKTGVLNQFNISLKKKSLKSG